MMLRFGGKRANAGCKRLISPMPGWLGESSIKTPRGQPPAGSSWSSGWKPVDAMRQEGRANWVARHRAG